MPDTGVYAFSIRKTTGWRGKTQGFSNLYHYRLTTPTTVDLENTLDALKAAEVPVHPTDVTFVEGRAWGPVGNDGRGGRMEAVRTFSGTGSRTPSSSFYKETALLIKWPLGRYGTKNRPQFLRKWLHAHSSGMAAFDGVDGTTDMGAAGAALATYISTVQTLTVSGIGSALPLMSASQHQPISAGVLNKYLEHHQFGR